MPRLSPADIATFIQAQPDWKMVDGCLVREYSFSDFTSAVAFVNRIAELAELQNHHPDIDIRYNRVRLSLISHDAGAVTKRDTNMAIRISHMQ